MPASSISWAQGRTLYLFDHIGAGLLCSSHLLYLQSSIFAVREDAHHHVHLTACCVDCFHAKDSRVPSRIACEAAGICGTLGSSLLIACVSHCIRYDDHHNGSSQPHTCPLAWKSCLAVTLLKTSKSSCMLLPSCRSRQHLRALQIKNIPEHWSC